MIMLYIEETKKMKPVNSLMTKMQEKHWNKIKIKI